MKLETTSLKGCYDPSVTSAQKAPTLHLFHTTVRHAASSRAESAPIHAVLMLCTSTDYYMTSLQFTQAQGLGCTRGM